MIDRRTATKPDQAGLPTGFVTFLFTDVQDSTPLWEADEAAMAAATDRHDEIVDAVVESHGGHVLRHKGEGDSTLSVFARASDAVAAAFALQRAFRTEPWVTPSPLRVRMSVHTGQAHEREMDYLGPTVNRAARLRGLAAGGQTYVSEATTALVRDRLPDGASLVEVGYRELRGFSRGELVFELADEDAPRDAPSGLRRAVPFPRDLLTASSFVGREEALQQLIDAWERPATPDVAAVFIGGEPGIGKTRLAAELAHRAHAEGALVLFGRCDELTTPYQPFVEAISALLAGASGADLSTLADPTLPALSRIIPSLPGATDEDTRARSADQEDQLHMLFEAVADVLAAAARTAPIVLVLDDLHWASRPTAELLRHLLQRSGPMRLLVLGTYRVTDVDRAHPLSEVLAALRREGKPTRLTLVGIDEASIAELLHAETQVPVDDVTMKLARAIHDETAGNPFFVREVVDHLVDRGVIRRTSAGASVTLSSADIGLPESVREVVRQRVARLTEPTQRVLSMAAVVGRTFSLDVLEPALGDTDGRSLEELEEAMARGLVREAGMLFEFTHALVRNALLQELSAPRRARMHKEVGQVLATLPGSSVHDLAHHFYEARSVGAGAEAAHYQLEAGRDLVGQLAGDEAIASFKEALSILEAEPELDHRKHVEALLALAMAERDFLEQGEDTFCAAALEARETGDVSLFADVAREAVWQARLGVPNAEILALVLEAADAIGPSDPFTAAALRVAHLSNVVWADPDLRTRPAEAERLVEGVRAMGDPALLAEAKYAVLLARSGDPQIELHLQLADEILGVWKTDRGRDPLRAKAAVDELVLGRREAFDARLRDIEEDLQPTSAAMRSVEPVFIGRLMLDGRFEEAMAEALRLFGESVGSPRRVTGFQLLWLFHELGRLDELGGLIEIARQELEHPVVEAARSVYLVEQGEHDAARDIVRLLMADGLAAAPRDIHWPVMLCWLAEAITGLEDRENASRLIEHLRPYSGQLVQFPMMSGVLGAADRFIAMLSSLLGSKDVAVQLFRVALDLEQRVSSPPLVARTSYWFARFLADTDVTEARRLLSDSIATAEELGMLRLAADADALMESLTTTGTDP